MSAGGWDVIYTSPYDVLERRNVEGGWLFRNRLVVFSAGHDAQQVQWGVALTFVPTPAAPLAETARHRGHAAAHE